MQITGSAFSSAYSASTTSQTRQRNKGEGELFAKADGNGDGKIDAAEMAALLAQMQSSKPTDAQGGGGAGEQPPAMSEEEIAALFSEADSDGDGYLSLEDFTAYGENLRANGQPPAGAPPGPPPAGGQPAEMSEEEMAALFTEADTDGDGVLSLEEFKAMHGKMAANAQAASSATTTTTTTDTAALDALKSLAQSSVGSLADMLFSDSKSSSTPMSLAEILADTRRNGTDSENGNSFSQFIQGLIEKAYQLGQQDGSASSAASSGLTAAVE